MDVVAAPDGGWLAIACRDRTVRLWDMGSGTHRQTLSAPTVDFGGYGSLVAGRDGRRVAGHWADGIVWVGDVTTGESRAHRIDDVVSGPQVAIAPDSERLVLGLQGSVQLRDAGTFALLDRFDIGVENQVRRLAIAPGGDRLIVLSDQSNEVRDLPSGKVHAVLPADRSWHQAAFNGDGSWLVTGRDTVSIWDAETLDLLREIPERFVSVAADGSCLLTRLPEGGLRLRALHGRDSGDSGDDESVDLPGTAGAAHGPTALAPGGQWFADCAGERVRIWRTSTRPLPSAPAFAPVDKERVLAATAGGGRVWLWTGGGRQPIRLRDAETGEAGSTMQPVGAVRDLGGLDACVMAPDGSWLAVATAERIHLLEPDGTGRHLLTGHRQQVRGITAAPDSTRLVSWGYDRQIIVWDAGTGARLATMPVSKAGYAVHDTAVAPDGTWLATANWDSRVRIRDLATGQNRRVLRGHKNSPTSLAVAPDGSWLASAADAEIIIWDAATGRVRAKLTNDFYVQRLAIAPNGRWLASLERRGAVTVWDPHDATVVAQLWTGSKFPTQAWPGSCVWSPDGTGLCVVIAGEAYVLDLVDR
ncbi:WD40 repeat [Nonomuraea solani]|uniref:WD40 repeat n=1 Tax=Nonomuraea solani TaxID=1144553 RepID=A0A1H6F3J2_9ACTN|nr:WD40 repeat [Nonomuraea solani]